MSRDGWAPGAASSPGPRLTAPLLEARRAYTTHNSAIATAPAIIPHQTQALPLLRLLTSVLLAMARLGAASVPARAPKTIEARGCCINYGRDEEQRSLRAGARSIGPARRYSNGVTSPAPTRTIFGLGPLRSTMLVGTVPPAPASSAIAKPGNAMSTSAGSGSGVSP